MHESNGILPRCLFPSPDDEPVGLDATQFERIVREVCAQRPVQAQKQMRTHLQNLKRELVKIMKLSHYPSN